jgi:hypothetical protein
MYNLNAYGHTHAYDYQPSGDKVPPESVGCLQAWQHAFIASSTYEAVVE